VQVALHSLALDLLAVDVESEEVADPKALKQEKAIEDVLEDSI